MALNTFFSLSASQPYVNTYNTMTPDDAPYAVAYLWTAGGTTISNNPWRLGDQKDNDELILGYNPADPADQTIANIVNDMYRRCFVRITFTPYNVSDKNQFLLVFGLRNRSLAHAQFFIGADWIRTEELGSGDDQVAILIDSPGTASYIQVYVRLASPNYYGRMGFLGVDCYLL